MLGRLFGRTKDDRDDTVCSACGRHLLAGEWTQRVVDDDGSERYICALCARAAAAPGFSSSPVIEPADDIATVTPARVKPARADSDAFWRALKDKDAEIERLQAHLARAEAENQELVAQLARLRGESLEAAPRAAEPLADAGEQTVAYTPADLAELEAVDAGPATTEPALAEHTDPRLGQALRAGDTWGDSGGLAAAAAAEVPVFDVGGAVRETQAVAARQAQAVDPSAEPATSPFDVEATGEMGQLAEADVLVASGNGGSDGQAAEPPGDDELVPLTILQRGVDLLNVSAVPRRIVETNEHLGIPQVHVGSENEGTLLITFMWTMGWYQFRVEIEGAGRITLADRGYDERVDLRPNASARNDGTVQLAPTRIRPATPRESAPGSGSGDPATTGVTRGVIISKSMKGQRTDDENVPSDWKTKRAPDFDWGR